MDAPLQRDNWDLVSASALPWSDENAVPREITPEEMEAVKQEFVAATEMAARAGFDMVELHAAHGYLLSSLFLRFQQTPRCLWRVFSKSPALAFGRLFSHASRLAQRTAHVGSYFSQ